MKRIDVVGAVIVRNGSVLCAQRGPQGDLAGLWEFPGGKIESGETPHEALVREIREELGCEVEVKAEVRTTRHAYDFGTIHLTTFYCVLLSGNPQATEHANVKWLPPQDLESLAWAPADVPAVRQVVGDLTP